MLSIGAAVLGSPHVLGIDVDIDALTTAAHNVAEADCIAEVHPKTPSGVMIGLMTCFATQQGSRSPCLFGLAACMASMQTK